MKFKNLMSKMTSCCCRELNC